MPNPARLPILAPMRNAQICPLASKEQWELRALPLGCNVSTLTFVSVLGTAIGIVLLGGIAALGVWIVKSAQQRWKESDYERLDEGPSLSWWNLYNLGFFTSSPGSIQSDRGENYAQAPNQDTTSEGNEGQSIGETRPLLQRM